jgi:hypothetical protein
MRENEPERIVERLSVDEPGNTVIVFDDRTTPAAYYLLAHGLTRWRIKRLTRREVEKMWDARVRAWNEERRRKADRYWENMIKHSVLDTLDQMGATPWRIPEFPYEACLAIDVGEDRRYFGMSLLICRPENHSPSFLRVTRTWHKGDHQHEAINPEFLRDKMVELVGAWSDSDFAPLSSMLILRDGHRPGDEPRGVQDGIACLKKDRLTEDATVHVVDVHKKTGKRERAGGASRLSPRR